VGFAPGIEDSEATTAGRCCVQGLKMAEVQQRGMLGVASVGLLQELGYCRGWKSARLVVASTGLLQGVDINDEQAEAQRGQQGHSGELLRVQVFGAVAGSAIGRWDFAMDFFLPSDFSSFSSANCQKINLRFFVL